MTTPVELTSERKPRSTRKLNITAVALVALASLFSSISLAATDSPVSAVKQQAKVASVGQPSAIGLKSSPPNPGYTPGPDCVYNVMLLLDRSFSVLNGGGWSDVNAFKASIHALYNALAARAGPGGTANVIVYAFGTYAIGQNGVGTQPAGWSWGDSINIANPYAQLHQAGLINNIYFTNSSSYPIASFAPMDIYRGYGGGVDITPYDGVDNPVIMYGSASGYGSTNYHDAFAAAANSINFFTNNNPSASGDQDIDMVVMVTDGEPTLNNGSDHLASPGEPSLSTGLDVDPADIIWAAYSVAQLRTGASFNDSNGIPRIGPRPPTNVRGILAGSAAGDVGAWGTMDQVFGSGNWLATVSYGQDLIDRLSQTIAPLTCAVSKTTVTTGIQATAVGPASIEEDETGNISVTVTNTGGTPVTNVRASVGGAVFATWNGILQPGTSITLSPAYSFYVPFGGPNPLGITVDVVSDAIFDPATEELAPGSSANPSDDDISNMEVIRVPLPS